jgi:mRNA interferase RelE/StbE
MIFEVIISESALKQVRKLERESIHRIKKHLPVLKEDPFKKRSGADIKKLKGFKNPELYRLRVGDYRLVYSALKNKVKITEVFHRSRGYSWLD